MRASPHPRVGCLGEPIIASQSIQHALNLAEHIPLRHSKQPGRSGCRRPQRESETKRNSHLRGPRFSTLRNPRYNSLKLTTARGHHGCHEDPPALFLCMCTAAVEFSVGEVVLPAAWRTSKSEGPIQRRPCGNGSFANRRYKHEHPSQYAGSTQRQGHCVVPTSGRSGTSLYVIFLVWRHQRFNFVHVTVHDSSPNLSEGVETM